MTKILITIAIILGIFLGLNHPKKVEVKGVRAEVIIPTVTPTPTPNTKDVIDEITEVWKDEPKHDIVRAINCAYSESGLRINALNTKNTNGTHDHSVFQVNDVHTKRHGTEFKTNWRENIRVAYQIYKNRGWSAWYGALCN